MRLLNIIYLLLILNFSCDVRSQNEIIPAAERSKLYLPLLEGKNVALVANHSSRVGETHLVDFLLSEEIQLAKIFSPEHGFRGDQDAGAQIESGVDTKTGLKIVSLYGSQKKPAEEDLKDVDLMVFDLQDVGVRFYTYISTLHYVMEACAENNIPLIVLDRPNPNGNYIDGPILKPEFKSFVGMHPVPVVYGMTIGEYAQMINGEGWLSEGALCDLKVIKCANYRHSSAYAPLVPPSPNLPDYLSIKLYPSLCFFEGTSISVGRGTDYPFKVFGHPSLQTGDFYFTPEPRPGAAINPKLKGEKCRGFDLRDVIPDSIREINLDYIILAYKNFPDSRDFFNSYFFLLSGNEELREQIEKGFTSQMIRESWEAHIEEFKKVRARYLLYP